MIVYLRKFLFLLFIIGFIFSANTQIRDSFQINSFSKVKDDLKKSLLIADDLEHSGEYVMAYMKYTEVGKMASEAGKLDYANDIYIIAITLREKHNLQIPHTYADRNLAFLNLCNHLRQNMNEKSVFWHKLAIQQTQADADTLTMLKIYKSFALYYMDNYDNENAIRINQIALPISKSFGDTVEYAINLLDFSDLLNKGLF